jgi:hypothetical protein
LARPKWRLSQDSKVALTIINGEPRDELKVEVDKSDKVLHLLSLVRVG